MKKILVHLQNQDDFDMQVQNNNITDQSIVFIKDTKTINTHGNNYSSVNWGYLGDQTEPQYIIDILTAEY